MQTNMTLDELRDMFFYEDRLDATIAYVPATQHYTLTLRKHLLPFSFDTVDEVAACLRGYYMCANANNVLPEKSTG